MSNKFMKDLETMLEAAYGEEKTEKIMETAWKNFEVLKKNHADESSAVKKHTLDDIYPAISIYKAMQSVGIDKNEAVSFLDVSCSKRVEGNAQMIRNLMKIPGLYKKMPAIFRWMTVNNFGEAAGFKADFYDTDKTVCKFDMKKCLYFDKCTAEGCPEIVKCFCHTDDVTDGNMHPKIKWHRTKTIGEGGDCCDFQIKIEE